MNAVIYDDGLPLIESPCVPFRYGNTPYKGYDDLKQYAYDEPEQFRPCSEQRSKDKEEQCIRKEKRDHLTEEQFSPADLAYLEGIVDSYTDGIR